MRTWILNGLVLALMTSCGMTEADPVQNAKTKADDVKDDVEAKVVDKLDCSGTITQETRTLISDALAAADFDPAALVTTPEELARFVGAVAVSTDTTAMLLGNVAQLATIGHMAEARAGTWDDMTCDDVRTVDCTDLVAGTMSGQATSTVECDAGTPSAVRLNFTDDCTLFVTQNAGAVALQRESGAYEFEDFSLGSVRQVDGVLAVDFESTDAHRVTVGQSEGISIATNAGKSCEERLTIREMIAETTSAALSLEIDAERLANEKTMSIATPSGPATFTHANKCTCPDPGSVMDWRWTGFIKGMGDANLRLNYLEAAPDTGCADVEVEILSWPDECDGETADCGKSAVQGLLGPLVAATCVQR